jgi:hypothetical protein
MSIRGEFLWGIVAEGAIDAVCGRPREANPYDPTLHAAEAWDYGWDEGRWLLEMRAEEEAARWLGRAS